MKARKVRLQPHLLRAKRLTLLCLVSAGCAAEPSLREWGGTIDTLANGAILTRSPATGTWSPNEEWTLQPDLRIGTATAGGPELFASIWDVTVDSAGRIYVLDGQDHEVRAFDHDGSHVWTIGRRGSGPGEFRAASGLAIGPDGLLWLADPGNGRYSVFDRSGDLHATYRSPVSGITIPWPGGVDTIGRPYDYTWIEGQLSLVRFRTAPGRDASQQIDTFEIPRFRSQELYLRDAQGTLRASMPVPFSPILVTYADPRGYLWSGITGSYRIVQATFEGDTLRVIQRAFDPVPVEDAEVDSALLPTREILRHGGTVEGPESPSHKPAFQWFTADDEGYLWVYPSLPGPEVGRVLEVFAPDGRYLGRVTAPFQFSPRFRPVIRGDRLYTVAHDSLDVPYVIRARIVGRPTG